MNTVNNAFGDQSINANRTANDIYLDACAVEEKALQRLMEEFGELKSAVDGHMMKMRAFATALKDIDVVVDNSSKVVGFV